MTMSDPLADMLTRIRNGQAGQFELDHESRIQFESERTGCV